MLCLRSSFGLPLELSFKDIVLFFVVGVFIQLYPYRMIFVECFQCEFQLVIEAFRIPSPAKTPFFPMKYKEKKKEKETKAQRFYKIGRRRKKIGDTGSVPNVTGYHSSG